jgi:hypothetical protein
LNTQGFTSVQVIYWTSSTYAGHAAGAWNVSMGGGGVLGDDKTVGYYAWPVRGGQSGTSVAATKPGDCDNSGTVTIAEVQSAINMFLGLKTVEACVNLDGLSGVSIAEVQKVINSFLGL